MKTLIAAAALLLIASGAFAVTSENEAALYKFVYPEGTFPVSETGPNPVQYRNEFLYLYVLSIAATHYCDAKRLPTFRPFNDYGRPDDGAGKQMAEANIAMSLWTHSIPDPKVWGDADPVITEGDAEVTLEVNRIFSRFQNVDKRSEVCLAAMKVLASWHIMKLQ